tara:strand:- start:9375 stop:10025 length:651 start_codon:yes stop_codon:yes gene_type:complete
MKTTIRHLRQIIKEEVQHFLYEMKYSDRFAARRAAGFDDEIMNKLDKLESTGKWEDYLSAYELATTLGSEETISPLIKFHSEPQGQDKGVDLIDEIIDEEVNYKILDIESSPDEIIQDWRDMGMEFDFEWEKPYPRGTGIESLFISYHEFVDNIIYKMLQNKLWSLFENQYSNFEVFEKDMRIIERNYKKQIEEDLEKYINNGSIILVDDIIHREI